MNDSCTTARRAEFEQLVYERVKHHGIGSKSFHCNDGFCCCFESRKIYAGLRQIDTAINGKVWNMHRLSESEFERLVILLDRVLPPIIDTPELLKEG